MLENNFRKQNRPCTEIFRYNDLLELLIVKVSNNKPSQRIRWLQVYFSLPSLNGYHHELHHQQVFSFKQTP